MGKNKCENCERLEETIYNIQNSALAMASSWDEFDKINKDLINSLQAEIASLKKTIEEI